MPRRDGGMYHLISSWTRSSYIAIAPLCRGEGRGELVGKSYSSPTRGMVTQTAELLDLGRNDAQSCAYNRRVAEGSGWISGLVLGTSPEDSAMERGD